MWRSIVWLDRHNRDLGDRYELHRTMARVGASLWRLDHACARLVVQTERYPAWGQLPARYFARPPAVGRCDPPPSGLAPFRLTANPTVKRDGRRWPLRGQRELAAWLMRKLDQAGARLVTLDPPVASVAHLWRAGVLLTIGVVDYTGQLAVVDAERLSQAMRRGIGPAKAFGCGLLLVGEEWRCDQ